jgi:myo-inositol-1(or 4)-monophosphatase
VRTNMPDSTETLNEFLAAAEAAARLAGQLQRDNYETDLDVNELADHDIKLDLDVRCQKVIADYLLAAFPDHALLGEEEGGDVGNVDSEYQWVVDPIDGTVNYFYGIPHFCVSIALRRADENIVGVIYDPMRDEMWSVTAAEGSVTELNGRVVSVSARERLADAVVTVGFSKTKESMDAGLEKYKKIGYRVRKTRMLGSAALALAYIACGRLDAYIEESVNLWDIAAGVLLLEKAGGKVTLTAPDHAPNCLSIIATNGRIPVEDVL